MFVLVGLAWRQKPGLWEFHWVCTWRYSQCCVELQPDLLTVIQEPSVQNTFLKVKLRWCKGRTISNQACDRIMFLCLVSFPTQCLLATWRCERQHPRGAEVWAEAWSMRSLRAVLPLRQNSPRLHHLHFQLLGGGAEHFLIVLCLVPWGEARPASWGPLHYL